MKPPQIHIKPPQIYSNIHKFTKHLHKYMKTSTNTYETSTNTQKLPQIHWNLHKFSKNLHKIPTKPAQRDMKLPLLFFLILQVMGAWKDESPRQTRRAATGAWGESVSIFHLYFTRGIKHGWYICRVLMVTVRFSRTRAARSWKCGQRNRLLRTSLRTVSLTESWFPAVKCCGPTCCLVGARPRTGSLCSEWSIHPHWQWRGEVVCTELREYWTRLAYPEVTADVASVLRLWDKIDCFGFCLSVVKH